MKKRKYYEERRSAAAFDAYNAFVIMHTETETNEWMNVNRHRVLVLGSSGYGYEYRNWYTIYSILCVCVYGCLVILQFWFTLKKYFSIISSNFFSRSVIHSFFHNFFIFVNSWFRNSYPYDTKVHCKNHWGIWYNFSSFHFCFIFSLFLSSVLYLLRAIV